METQLSLSAPLEYMLARAPVGLAVLDAVTLRIYYANPQLLSYLEKPHPSLEAANQFLQDLLPPGALATLEAQADATGENRHALHLHDIPYEGFLETRGRTYWNITIEPDRQGSLASL